MDVDREFITVIPEKKIKDLEYVEQQIIKNREYSVAHRDEIREYAKEFEWKNVLAKNYIPSIEKLIAQKPEVKPPVPLNYQEKNKALHIN